CALPILPESYYEEVRGVYAERVGGMVDALEALPGVVAPRPAGAFYSMVELPVSDTERFARWLVESFRHEGESVVVAPGPGFYASPSDGRNQIRLAAVNDVATLRRGVELIGLGVEAFRREHG
ncbi:MAG: hypothetical protein KC621_26750, partial [Myxococcales bacterium]|nr:hypothetical protein [Myxococcales bacterium]